MKMNGIKIEFKTRPCLAEGVPAQFHQWENYSDVIAPSIAIGGHPGGQIGGTRALVELENGKIRYCDPLKIQFIDENAPPRNYTLVVKTNCALKDEHHAALLENLKKQIAEKRCVLLPHYCEVEAILYGQGVPDLQIIEPNQ